MTRRTTAQVLADSVPEKDCQANIVAYAHLKGWKVAHFRPGLNQRGMWHTAVAADGAGFPDLVLTRERVVFVEVKAHGGVCSLAQIMWRVWLRKAGAEYHLWKQRDQELWERVLE